MTINSTKHPSTGLDKLGDLIGNDSHAMTFQTLGQYRNALLKAIAQQAGALTDYVLMPKRLTAENGAKGALSGEFKESITVTCHECDGSGDDAESDNDAECPECKGDGTLDQAVTVTWDTIKDIYKAAVALLAAPAPYAAADPERAKWTTKQWYEHVGAWETPEGFVSFGSVMALGAMLIQFQRAVAVPATYPTIQHPDDEAVDRFAAAMKNKMAANRAKGRSGWDDPTSCSAARLQIMLVEHLAKGDPVDIGNFAMMLWNRGDPVAVVGPRFANDGSEPDWEGYAAAERKDGAA